MSRGLSFLRYPTRPPYMALTMSFRFFCETVCISTYSHMNKLITQSFVGMTLERYT